MELTTQVCSKCRTNFRGSQDTYICENCSEEPRLNFSEASSLLTSKLVELTEGKFPHNVIHALIKGNKIQAIKDLRAMALEHPELPPSDDNKYTNNSGSIFGLKECKDAIDRLCQDYPEVYKKSLDYELETTKRELNYVRDRLDQQNEELHHMERLRTENIKFRDMLDTQSKEHNKLKAQLGQEQKKARGWFNDLDQALNIIKKMSQLL